MHLVDRLITAIKEQDVLYTIIWIKDIDIEISGGDLGQKINKLHSTEDCTPFSAAVELPYSPLRNIILQLLLLSGADFRGCRLRSKTQEMGKRFNKVRSDWASGEKDQAHDAKMLLNLPLEEAADWIDEHLPPPPNSDSLTGSDIPLPPSPRSTPILATAPLFSPPRVSIPLPKKTQHQIEEPKRLDETPKSRDQLALIPSTPVKDEQGTTALPSPPSTAELAATATFSSKLPSFTPPPESVETPASPLLVNVAYLQSPVRLEFPFPKPPKLHSIAALRAPDLLTFLHPFNQDDDLSFVVALRRFLHIQIIVLDVASDPPHLTSHILASSLALHHLVVSGDALHLLTGSDTAYLLPVPQRSHLRLDSNASDYRVHCMK